MPLFSRQPLAAAAAAAAAAVAVKCVSDSALPPLLHFLTNFHNRLRQHLAFSISLCLLLLLPQLRFFFQIFPKNKKIFRDWNLFSFLAFFWCCCVRVLFLLVMIFLTSAVFASAIMPILSTCDGCT
jgi:hypothetical protein